MFWRRGYGRTVAVLNAASILEKADEQLMPSVYREIATTFHASPTDLGSLTFSRAVLQAIASPCFGLLGDTLDRRIVVALGACFWGFAALALGHASSWPALFFWR